MEREEIEAQIQSLTHKLDWLDGDLENLQDQIEQLNYEVQDLTGVIDRVVEEKYDLEDRLMELDTEGN